MEEPQNQQSQPQTSPPKITAADQILPENDSKLKIAPQHAEIVQVAEQTDQTKVNLVGKDGQTIPLLTPKMKINPNLRRIFYMKLFPRLYDPQKKRWFWSAKTLKKVPMDCSLYAEFTACTYPSKNNRTDARVNLNIYFKTFITFQKKRFPIRFFMPLSRFKLRKLMQLLDLVAPPEKFRVSRGMLRGTKIYEPYREQFLNGKTSDEFLLQNSP